MRLQLIYTIVTVFSAIAIAGKEKKPSSDVVKSFREMYGNVKLAVTGIYPPAIHNPDGPIPLPPNPDHAWLEGKVKTEFPKIREAYKKNIPLLANSTKQWHPYDDFNDVDPDRFCQSVGQLFSYHARLARLIVKYYSGFKDEIKKEIETEIVSFQKQCKKFDDRLGGAFDSQHYSDCAKAHKLFKSAKSNVEKLLKLGGSAELR